MSKVKFFIGDIVSGYTDVMGKQQEIVLVLSLDDIDVTNASEAEEHSAWLRRLGCTFVRSDHPLHAIMPEAMEAYVNNRLANLLEEI